MITRENKSDDDQLQIATCILLIEVSFKSDDDYDIDEQKKLSHCFKKVRNVK